MKQTIKNIIEYTALFMLGLTIITLIFGILSIFGL
jgi:hypothetical protein